MIQKGVYLVILKDGGGDTYVRVVDEETWTWITNEDDGSNGSTDLEWDDRTCPRSVRRRLWERAKDYGEDVPNDPEDFKVVITRGSWDNDRAIMSPPIVVDDARAEFDSVTDAVKWINRHGLTLKDEYHGYVY